MTNQRDIKYTITAEVDGELIFKGEYEDTLGLEMDLSKAERAVENALEVEDE